MASRGLRAGSSLPFDGLTNVDGRNPLDLSGGMPPAKNPPVWDPALLIPSATAITTIQSQALPQVAPIPSPLAILGRRQTELTVVVNVSSASVRDLWHHCAETQNASHDNHIRHEIFSGQSRKGGKQYLHDTGVGFIAWIERASAPEQDEMQVSDDESGDDESPPAKDTLRSCWITSGNRISLEASGRQSGVAILGQQSKILNIRRSQKTDGGTAHFIIHSSQSTLTINGIRVRPGGIAGPLPSFAVIEVGSIAVFWWNGPKSLNYIPQGPAKTSKKRSHALDPEEEYENFNDDEEPLAKRAKVLENPSRFAVLRRPARMASGKVIRSGGWTGRSGVDSNKLRNIKDLPPRAPQSPRPGIDQGLSPARPPKVLPPRSRSGVKPGQKPPGTKKPLSLASTPTRDEPLFPALTTWRQQLQERLQYWREERERALREEKAAQESNTQDKAPNRPSRDAPYQIKQTDNLDDSEVVQGIASVWRPLIDWGTNFAFGNSELFQARRLEKSFMEVDCVLPQHPFVIPLILNQLVHDPPGERLRDVKRRPPKKSVEELNREKEMDELKTKRSQAEQEKDLKKQARAAINNPTKKPKERPQGNRAPYVGGVGHFVLAAAERVPGTTDGVRLTFWDSAPSNDTRDVIRACVRNIVRYSGWMPPDVWPRFIESEERWPESPRQIRNTCGMHVLLNAWAYMLNIPLNPRITMGSRFYDAALEIINLSLRGLMDAPTIRAFLHANKYAAPQDFAHVQQVEASTRPDQPREMHHLPQTARVNIALVDDMISGLRSLNETQISAEESRRTSGQGKQGSKPPKSTIPPKDPISLKDLTTPKSSSLRKQTPARDKTLSSKIQRTSPGKKSSPPKKSTTQDSAEESRKSSGQGEQGSEPPKDPIPPKDPTTPKPSPLGKQTPAKDKTPSLKVQRTSPGKKSSPTKKSTAATGRDILPPPSTWEEILEAGITQQNDAARNSNKPASYTLSTVESNALDDSDVVYTIASVWAGLRNSGCHFGFGTPDTFQWYRDPANGTLPGSTAVGGPYPLIIPLIFGDALETQRDQDRAVEEIRRLNKGREWNERVRPSRNSEIGGIGHFILAVARRGVRGAHSTNEVTIFAMDSAPGSISQFDYTAVAQNIVRYSGWMGVNMHGVPLRVEPTFRRLSVQAVPLQREQNNCGFHAILNAWAVMLRVPVHSGEERRLTAWRGHVAGDSDFYRVGKQIMNLAVQGFMDSRTIQAFMMVFGYAKDRSVDDAKGVPVIMQSVAMNTGILNDIMGAARDEEQNKAIALGLS